MGTRFTMDDKRNLIGHPSDYGSRTLESELEQQENETNAKTDDLLEGDPIAAQEIAENGSNT
jgi:hypothetical protein